MGAHEDADLRMPRCRGCDIEEASIKQLQQWLGEGAFSSWDLTSCYLTRIERLNNRLRAVIETNPDALSIAAATDRERQQGTLRSPLHGIPFLVKDNIATDDQMQTTAGSSMLIGAKVPRDAHAVRLLRNSGAVLLGHANMSEWASMRATHYAEGYSSRGGQSRNPYNLAESPGGSSSGSAIAVATNMCSFSLGTETDSSIILPADRNGVVGIKPTLGVTSCEGVIPESRHFDVVGTFGRTVEDAALALDAICSESGMTSHPGAYAACVSEKEVLAGAKFGLPRKRVWEKAARSDAKRFQYDALRHLLREIRKAGAIVLDPCDIPSAETLVPVDGSWDWDYPSKEGQPERSEFTIVKVDFYNELRQYLGALVANPKEITSLEDVMDYNIKHTSVEGGVPRTHPAWPTGQDSFEQSADSMGTEDDVYHSALAHIRRASREEGIDKALCTDGEMLDGLLVPIQADGGVAMQIAAKAGEKTLHCPFCQVYHDIDTPGYPMITIPVGTDGDGVPFGIALIHKAHEEQSLVRYGSAIERLVGGRPTPRFQNQDANNHPYVGDEPTT